MSADEKDKKNFWEDFFGTLEEYDEPTYERRTRVPVRPVRDEDGDLMSILQGNNKKYESESIGSSKETQYHDEIPSPEEEEVPLPVEDEGPLENFEEDADEIPQGEPASAFEEGAITIPIKEEGDFEQFQEEAGEMPRAGFVDEFEEEPVPLPVKEEFDPASFEENVNEEPKKEGPVKEFESGSAEGTTESEKEEMGNLYQAPADQYFYINNGPTLKNLYDLEYYLGTMTNDQFNYHTADDKNDFASWVRNVIKEEKLAVELENTRDRKEMYDILARFLSLK